jgi:hypothetical protein
VGSLFPLLAILACGAVIFAVIPIAEGQPVYAIPAGVLFLVLAGFATAESFLSLHQAAHVASQSPHSEVTEQDGPLPLMTVEITDPFGGGDHAHEVGPHDLPPGHPARRALREAAERDS